MSDSYLWDVFKIEDGGYLYHARFYSCEHDIVIFSRRLNVFACVGLLPTFHIIDHVRDNFFHKLIFLVVLVCSELDYTQARYHFIRSTDGKGCAAMLIEYHIVRGFPSEVDLFIAQAVFQ